MEQRDELELAESALWNTLKILKFWSKEAVEKIDDIGKHIERLEKRDTLATLNTIKKCCYMILAMLEDLKRYFYDYYDLRKYGKIGGYFEEKGG